LKFVVNSHSKIINVIARSNQSLVQSCDVAISNNYLFFAVVCASLTTVFCTAGIFSGIFFKFNFEKIYIVGNNGK